MQTVLSVSRSPERLGNPEIDHLGHSRRRRIVQAHQDVGGLDVAVDDSLLMRVLDRLADLEKQFQPLDG